MGLVSEAFSELDEQLKLSPDTHAEAKRIREELEETLKAAGLEVSSLIQGSYGRKTMRPPLKDVDLVVLACDAAGKNSNGEWDIEAYVRRVKVAICESGRFPGVRFDDGGVSKRPLQLSLPDINFTVDVVPARESGSPGWLLLGDRVEGTWDYPSDVRVLLQKVSARNQQCGGKWVRQVRMAKSALTGDSRVKDLVSGFLIESAAYDVVLTSTTHPRAVAAILAQLASVSRGEYTGLGQNDLTDGWSSDDRRHVIEFFNERAQSAQHAVRAEERGDEEEAIRLWKLSLGSSFPAPSQSFFDTLADVNTVGGGLTPAGALATSGTSIRPSRPWGMGSQ